MTYTPRTRAFAFAAVALVLLIRPVVSHTLAGDPAAEARPNIVWVFVEDMNGWFGCYGDDTVPTPNLDALADRGVRFTRTYMTAGVCSACRSAIATGAMQTSLGIHNHRSSRGRAPGEEIHLPDGVKTVYQMMREAGYYVVTQGMNKNDFNFIWDSKDLYDVNGGGYARQSWRDRPDGKPFFIQVQLKGGKNSGKVDEKSDPDKMVVAPYYPDHPVIRREYAHHYDTIKQTDNELGLRLANLKADGLLDSTVIFFWTDHGMRLPRHKQWLYEGGINVPLIVAGPGVAAKKVRDDLVSGIDITVTTLGLAGAEPGAWMEGRDFFAVDHEPREYVVSARDRCDYTIERVRSVTTKRYKYIRNFLTDRPFMQPQYRDGRDYVEVPRKLYEQGKLNYEQKFMWNPVHVPEELYDLEADPHETRNLADDPAHATELARHRAILDTWIKETDDKGQQPESAESLHGVLKQWNKKAVNPEYDAVREKFNIKDPHS